MQPDEIRGAIAGVIEHFHANPPDAKSQDKPATATLEEGLRIRVEAGDGSWVVTTDMPTALGGDGSAPTPGWLRRAAQAACEATMIAITAAQEGIDLRSLEVTVGSTSDDRGMLGAAEGVPAGPSASWTRVSISARDASSEKLREMIDRAERHSPVTDALCRAVPHSIEVEVT